MGSPLYHLENICHFYGEKKVLDIESLQVPAGSILGISGPNGSGKSTLLKLLAFAMKPSQGVVRFNGRPELPQSPRVRSHVTLMTQKPYLLKRSVLDNVVYGLKVRKDTDRLKERAAMALDAVGLDYDRFHRRQWHELSGGEAQRVAMAARLILTPQALLLDEPVASVDAKSARLIRQASLAARKEWGCTLVIVSHDLNWLHECSDTRLSMARGRIFSTGKESILPPPYTGGKKDGILLESGETILLTPRPAPGATAVIRKDRIKISPTQALGNGYDNQITARITTMIQDRRFGRILTTLTMGHFSLDLSFTPDRARELALLPGKKIILMFRSQDIAWR